MADDKLLRHDFAVDALVAADMAQQQLAGALAHERRLVDNGRQLRRDVAGVLVVGEAAAGPGPEEMRELYGGGEE